MAMLMPTPFLMRLTSIEHVFSFATSLGPVAVVRLSGVLIACRANIKALSIAALNQIESEKCA
jgi:hypothetical protein